MNEELTLESVTLYFRIDDVERLKEEPSGKGDCEQWRLIKKGR